MFDKQLGNNKVKLGIVFKPNRGFRSVLLHFRTYTDSRFVLDQGSDYNILIG